MKNLGSLMITTLFSIMSIIQADAQNTDPVRDKLKWDSPAAPSNEDGLVEKVYLGYTRPDGIHFDIVAELPCPVEPDQFKGGDVKEIDFNFDGVNDLMISLGSLNGFGDFVYEGYVWNTTSQRFDRVPHFSEIVNPEINADNHCISGHNRIDNVIEVTEWMWKGPLLVKINTNFENAEEEGCGNCQNCQHHQSSLTPEQRMQNKALEGKWVWVTDGQLPSDIQLILQLSADSGILDVDECQIYGSNAAFNLSCTYQNGILNIDDATRGGEYSSLSATLQLNPRGDLYGSFQCKVGESISKGTVTLRMIPLDR